MLEVVFIGDWLFLASHRDATISAKKCLELSAPQAVVELVKCGCHSKSQVVVPVLRITCLVHHCTLTAVTHQIMMSVQEDDFDYLVKAQ